ncbi:MAG: BMC domain-containing protein [Cyanobacteria bacterium P01_H01_bin.15]
MLVAVGTIQSLGFPSILAASDAVVKGARVTIVHFDKAERGNFYITFRGPVSEVKRAMEAGKAAVEETFGGVLTGEYIVPHPTANVETILPFQYTEATEAFH